MRSAEAAHDHLQCQLAGSGRKTRTDAGDLRDRAGGRCGEADADPVTGPAAQRRNPVRRPARLAGDPVQPQEPAGDRPSACDPDGAATADAGSAEGIGDQDAVRIRRPGLEPGPIIRGRSLEKESGQLRSGNTICRQGLWVPAQGRDDNIGHPSARNSRRSTLPVAVIGRVSVNCTSRGYSWSASCTLTKSWISRASASPGAKPGRSTIQALIDSVRTGSGMPTTADIATAGCFISVCSISDGPTR